MNTKGEPKVAQSWKLRDPLVGQFLIMPENIDVSNHFSGAFGNMETEISANWLVRFAQQRGKGWTPFTEKEIDDFYHQGTCRPADETFSYNRLIDPEMVCPGLYEPSIPEGGGWILRSEGGKLFFTPEFVIRCFESSLRR